VSWGDERHGECKRDFSLRICVKAGGKGRQNTLEKTRERRSVPGILTDTGLSGLLHR
jgi:hypothetical protein